MNGTEARATTATQVVHLALGTAVLGMVALLHLATHEASPLGWVTTSATLLGPAVAFVAFDQHRIAYSLRGSRLEVRSFQWRRTRCCDLDQLEGYRFRFFARSTSGLGGADGVYTFTFRNGRRLDIKLLPATADLVHALVDFAELKRFVDRSLPDEGRPQRMLRGRSSSLACSRRGAGRRLRRRAATAWMRPGPR